MVVLRREIDNDVRSPTYLCEVEDVMAVQRTLVPAWILFVLMLVLIAVARIEDVAAAAHWLDRLFVRSGVPLDG
jgi:hypothetical protein